MNWFSVCLFLRDAWLQDDFMRIDVVIQEGGRQRYHWVLKQINGSQMGLPFAVTQKQIVLISLSKQPDLILGNHFNDLCTIH